MPGNGRQHRVRVALQFSADLGAIHSGIEIIARPSAERGEDGAAADDGLQRLQSESVDPGPLLRRLVVVDVKLRSVEEIEHFVMRNQSIDGFHAAMATKVRNELVVQIRRRLPAEIQDIDIASLPDVPTSRFQSRRQQQKWSVRRPLRPVRHDETADAENRDTGWHVDGPAGALRVVSDAAPGEPDQKLGDVRTPGDDPQRRSCRRCREQLVGQEGMIGLMFFVRDDFRRAKPGEEPGQLDGDE